MIGITLGEHFGIGYEILAQSLSHLEQVPVIIYGDQHTFAQTCQRLSISTPSLLRWHQIDCQAASKDQKEARGQYVLDQLSQAMADAKQGIIEGLLTCPIDKNIVRTVHPGFDGHTSYLQQQTNSNYSIMLMRNKDFAIVVGTQHIPLREVARIFTQAYFEQLVHQTLDAFTRHFRQPAPRLAILGINPHAGEIDPEAEEKKWMQTSIQKLQAQGIQIQGPFPADSFFAKARHQNWDAIISPYHDQALIAAKYNGLADVVNITLGLPFLRTSPGHGVAYDIAGQGKADASSFQTALNILIQQSLSF